MSGDVKPAAPGALAAEAAGPPSGGAAPASGRAAPAAGGVAAGAGAGASDVAGKAGEGEGGAAVETSDVTAGEGEATAGEGEATAGEGEATAGGRKGRRRAGGKGRRGGGKGGGLVVAGRRYSWDRVEAAAASTAVLLFLVLVWAGFTQHSQWTVVPFVLLFYGTLLGTVAATYAARRAGGGLGWGSTLVRGLLWLVVGVLALWFWFPPTVYVYSWLFRHLSVYFLSP